MFSSMGQTNVKNLGNGGTMDGDVTITGDLTVSGGIGLSLSEVIEGTSTIDVNSTEALLVRKNGDGGDVFVVDTTNGDVTVQNSSNAFLNITSTGGGARMKLTGQADETTNGILFYETTNVRGQINYNHADQKMEFKTGDSNTLALTIDSSQRFGIGTDSPSQMLHIASPTDAFIQLERVDTSVADNDAIGAILFRGGESSIADIGRIRLHADADFTSSSSPTKMVFETTPSGTTVDAVALTLSSDQSATFAGDITVSGGDMTLTGSTTSIIGEQSAGANRGKIKFVTSSSDGDIVFETTTNGAGAITEAGRFTHEGHLTVAQNINLGDDKALTLGADGDAQIWNDGSNTYIRNNISDQDIIFRVNDGGTANTEAMRIDGATANVDFSSAVVMDSYLTLKTTDDQANNWVLYTHTDDSFQMNYNGAGNAEVVVTNSGNVGIGSTAPMGSSDGITGLEIGGSATPGLTLKSTGSSQIYSFWADGSGNISLQDNTNDLTRLRVASNGNVSIGGTHTASGILDVRANSSKVGFGTDSSADFGEIYFGSGVAINFAHETNDNAGGIINFRGYDNGTSQFRDLTIADGKGNTIAFFDGSASSSTFSGVTTVKTDSSPAFIVEDANGDNQFQVNLNASTGGEIAVSDGGGSEKIRFSARSGGNSYINTAGSFGFGIGTSSPKTHLDVQSYQADGITIGADNDANRTRTNSTSKSGGITGVHYTNAEESIRLLGYSSSSSANILLIGGGNGDWNSATDINFYVGANTTTTSGDLRFKLDTNSRISLSNNDSGTSNTVLGYGSGANLDAGSNENVFIGHQVSGNGTNNDSLYNVGIGFQSLFDLAGGDGNTAIGHKSLFELDEGQFNVSIGKGSLQNLTSGSSNVAIGTDALGSPTTAEDIVAIGRGSAYAVNNDTADGIVAIGRNALASNTSGSANLAVGMSVLEDITTGSYNTVVGHEAMQNAQTGVSLSTAVGYRTGYKLGDDGDSDHSDANIMIGYLALGGGSSTVATNTANFNIAIGNNSLGGGSSTASTMAGNTVIGHDASKVATSGADNTIIGKDAAISMTTGYFNTIIGKGANPSAVGGTNQIVIGRATTGVGDNSVTLGNSSVTDVYMADDSGATVHCANINLGGVSSGGANTLDKYEEGTWTPTFVSASGHAPTISATYVNDFTKVGNVVTVSLYIGFSNDGGGTDGVQISGLPTAIPANTFHMVPAVFRRTNFTSNIMQYGLTVASTDDIGFYYTNSTGDRVGLTYDDIDVASNNLILTFTYLDA